MHTASFILCSFCSLYCFVLIIDAAQYCLPPFVLPFPYDSFICFACMQDHNLVLVGPTRAVFVSSPHPVTIEVDLKVKGTTESEDKDLSFLAVPLLCLSTHSRLFHCSYTSVCTWTSCSLCRGYNFCASHSWVMAGWFSL